MAILTFSLSKVAKVKIYLYYHTLAYSTGSKDLCFELFHRELTDPTSFLGEKQIKWAARVLSYLLHIYSQV